MPGCVFVFAVDYEVVQMGMVEKLGKDFRFKGGVNKMELVSKERIDRELARLLPLVEDGGFIPHVDHRVPPDITLENYEYYLKRKREVFGIPQP